jgi:hypothetical protein
VMDDGVARVFWVEAGVLTGVGLVGSGDLEASSALGASDEDDLAAGEAVEALEEVDTAQGDALPGAAVVAGEGDLEEEPAEHGEDPLRWHSESGMRDLGGVAGLAKELFDAGMGPEGDLLEHQRTPTVRAGQGIGAGPGPVTLSPAAVGEGSLDGLGLGSGRGWFVAESATSLREVASPPTGGEEAAVADHLEVLVGDVADEATDEGEDGKGLEGGLAAPGVVLEGEADVDAVVVGDAVFGQHGPLRVATDVAEGGGGIQQAGPDVGVPGDVPELVEKAVEAGVGLEDGPAGREAELAGLVGLAKGGDDVVLPHPLEAGVVHEPAHLVGLDPAVPVEGESPFGDEEMDVGMPPEVGAEGVDHRDDPHAHLVLLAGPLVEGGGGGLGQDGEAEPAVQDHEGTELPGHGEDQMVIGHLEEVAQGPVGPLVGGVLAAGGAEAGLAGVGDDPGLVPIRAHVDMAAQGRCATGPELPDGLQDHGPDPAPLRLEELLPVGVQDRGDPVADLLPDGQHGKRMLPSLQGLRNQKSSRAKRAKFRCRLGSGPLALRSDPTLGLARSLLAHPPRQAVGFGNARNVIRHGLEACG